MTSDSAFTSIQLVSTATRQSASSAPQRDLQGQVFMWKIACKECALHHKHMYMAEVVFYFVPKYSKVHCNMAAKTLHRESMSQ